MTTLSLENYLEKTSLLINQHLDQFLPENQTGYRQLFSAARYSLIGLGKRLRPILTLATTEVLGGDSEKALSPACTLELIHTYSLIHDDLPCMDDDDFRRGKPSLHKAFPEGHAVLTGDFLLTYAFGILADDPLLSAETKIQLISTLAKQCGAEGMIGGQIMDLEAEKEFISLETLQEIHLRKTAALIIAAVDFGAIIANASPQQRKSLLHFAKNIGLAFQVVDDILDLTSSKEELGKPIASDMTNHKATYVSLLGIEKAKEVAQSLLHCALENLEQLDVDTTLLANIAKNLVHRTY